ncbi:ATP-binding cassette domain-containing protein [Microbacterium sp. MEC084]|uniref:amino acid ABC transporter ATP-binding protein n=1 Tax=Microbacterium sp. MEC084 TaxID=1963027 RepID=UPI00106F9389|nr:amino acid ABC transporter ATP-binding protein [Microbacterium sp. MEC084]MCD1270039.1 ATP-binding cassette domain-containing protein [Microbacterium sp. MEC084]
MTGIVAPVGASEPVIRTIGVNKSYGANQVLHDIDVEVHEGEVVTLIGPSGSGKTTLLRTFNRLEDVSSGEILLDGKPLGQRLRGNGTYGEDSRALARDRQRIGFVFQHFNLFPHMTAAENVWHAPVRVKGEDRRESLENARRLLARVGLERQADQKPATLSGGQQQRVAIARALAMKPRLLLFDEPTSALDPEMTQEVLRTIQELAEEGVTMVIVTHEMDFARMVSDRVVMMEHGVVIETGTAEAVLGAPTHERTRAFIANLR